MILVVDCGNTNTVFALYSYDKSIKKIACWRINNNSKRYASPAEAKTSVQDQREVSRPKLGVRA